VCRFRLAFFGLTSNYIEYVYRLLYLLVTRTNWQFIDLYKFAIAKRNWIFETYVKEVEEQREDGQTEKT